MDGEVLIIGRVVGWSGGVPKSLVSGEARTPGFDLHSLFFEDVFSKAFFSIFCDVGSILGGFWRRKSRPKSISGRFFFDAFFECV